MFIKRKVINWSRVDACPETEYTICKSAEKGKLIYSVVEIGLEEEAGVNELPAIINFETEEEATQYLQDRETAFLNALIEAKGIK